ncbi:ribonuclease H-like domain-containing protein [Coniochaeta sp. 2T2.1]|nr:ribonuclease H-like domain-containing protein [Coniochaeta sp. 2T2.1]
MAPELSSNWKKLQATIKAESTRGKPSSSAKDSLKRKATPDHDEELDSEVARVFGESLQKNKKVARGPNSIALKPRAPKKGTKPSTTTKDAKPIDTSKPTSQMGNAHSTPQDVPKATVTPSLALWAEDNGISSEALAEAYGLGAKDTSMIKDVSSIRPNEGHAPNSAEQLGKYLGIDCEMVGVGENGAESVLARVSIVDFHGKQVYDSYVRPKERVTDWRTHVSGIAPKHMYGAREFDEVQRDVAALMKGRILVGHDIRHDLAALLLEHPSKLIRDTARFSGFRKYGHGPKPALRVLAREILDVEIQTGQHSSIEDARVAMLLFRRHKPAFDVEHANTFGEDRVEHKAKPQKAKKKRKN